MLGGVRDKWIQLVDINGESFHAPILQEGGLPVVKLVLSGPAAAAFSVGLLAENAIQKAIRCRVDLFHSDALHLLHLRFGHATGHRLYNTLKEKGLAHRTTLAACEVVSTSCKACEKINVRLEKIPAKTAGSVEVTKFNQVIYQDLIHLPARSPQGHVYSSVIVDSSTRYVSVLAIKQKSQAVQHLIAWVRRWESKFGIPKIIKTDNGGEFIGSEYTEFYVKEGIAPLTGAPYTPQTQALVERTNQSIKRLLTKTLFSLQIPQEMSAYIISGVAQTFNELVHSSTGESPYSMVHGHGTELLPLAMGDVVLVTHVTKLTHQPVPTNGEEGIFVCFISAAVASILVKRDYGWHHVRVHPSRLRLKGWLGLCSLSNLQHVTQSSEVPTISAPADRDSLCDFSSSRTVVPPPPAPDPAPVISRHPFVIARHRNGAVFPAQVLQRSRLQMAALERDTNGKWQHKELLFPNHHSIMKELVGATAEEAFSPSVFEEFLSSAPSASRGDDPEHGLDVPQAGGAEIDAEDAMLPTQDGMMLSQLVFVMTVCLCVWL
eukprot:GHVR01157151.1.p1 GENE.GHVR01157151.1~~GHVR01157151.1.p1  ORF type:complete len:547 (+),score=56.06 GHVR01157151.1:1117-2757(+)